MKRSSFLAAILGLAMCAPAVGAETPRIKRLDDSAITPVEIGQTVKRLMRAADVTGAGIAIFNDGKIAYLKAYGVRDREKNLPLTPDSVMTAASFTKVAFGYTVMQLA